jgi:hypothetical protein
VTRKARRVRVEQDRQGIDHAVAAYADLDRGEAQPIRIRRPFIRLPERRVLERSGPYADCRAADLKSRPPPRCPDRNGRRYPRYGPRHALTHHAAKKARREHARTVARQRRLDELAGAEDLA